jgi:type VI secretion system secreted protein VgrG
MMALTDQPLCSFSSTATPLDTLLVLDWSGEEALSRPYRFDIRLATLNPLLDEEVLLGKPATLNLTDALGLLQPYHGVVTEVEQLDSNDRYFYFRVVLEPRMALLRQHRFSEMWLDKNLPDLLDDVLKGAGLVRQGPGVEEAGAAGDYDFDIRLPGDDLALVPVSFTCQFEESSLAFLSRLLEYYGIYYFFEQQAGHEALVLCGDLRYQPKGEILVSYRPLDSALDAEKDVAMVRSFKRRIASQSRQVVLQDFSASDAQLQLRAEASVAQASQAAGTPTDDAGLAATASAFQGDYSLYGQHFGSSREGQWLASRRAQAIGCRHREFHGSGRASGLRAGYLMQLAGHPRLTMNVAYQVIEVFHDGSQPLPGLGEDQSDTAGSINTRFVALPANVQFRAPLITPRPHVQGVLSAVVDGDQDTGLPLLNSHGCYKVSFPFIRGEKGSTRGSAWLRLASMSSGSSHGMHFPLLKGAEVLVSFLGGDPDRPIIVGSVPNSENPSMVNAANATQSGISTPGGHYLAMEDSKAGSLMKMGAPGGNTTFTLGHGVVSGAHLATDAHMQLSSSSHKHTVPGMYSLSIGSDDLDIPDSNSGGDDSTANSPDKKHDESQEEKDQEGEKELLPTVELKDSHWGGPAWLNLGAKVGWSNARSVSVELKTSVMQVEASVGLTKQDLSVLGYTLGVSIAGPKTELSIHPGAREFKTGFTGTVAARMEKALSKKENHVTVQEAAVTRDVKTGTYTHAAVALMSFSCGPHKISLTPAGIVVESPTAVNFKSDVNIEGKLTVSDDVVCNRNCSVSNKLKALMSISTPEMTTVSLKAGKANLAYPVVADMWTGELIIKSAMAAMAKAIDLSEKAGKAVAVAAVEVADVAQDALEDASNNHPLM